MTTDEVVLLMTCALMARDAGVSAEHVGAWLVDQVNAA